MCDSDNSEDQSDQPCAKKVKLHYGILPSHQVNNSKRERQKQYRERNRDKLKHREAERRERIQSSQSIIGPSTSSNSNIMEVNNEEPVTAISSILQNKRDRQKRYWEKNREKLSQREVERRRRLQNAESIIELYTSPNIGNREIITEPIIIIDEVRTNSRNLTGLGEMEHEVFDISQQNLSNLSSANIAAIPNNYSQFRYHKTAHEYFIDNFKNNEFGHACSICDRFWFEKDLKKPSTSGNIINTIANVQNVDSSELRRKDRREVDPYHLLYMAVKIMRLRVRDCLTIAFKHVGTDSNITKEQIQSEDYIHNCMESNLAFLRSIPNSVWYWSSRKKDLFAMMRQLGKPTAFMTLSANEIG
ncbi:uncharacterized protein LOC141531548 isoform X2 [Cotesia typhae]|uniref:uncharacterized protein LOC141531548 isoform X2 n=1 Tax=Cotesia typhae TaxID=2053667 RepID=UPI003D69B3F5